MINKFRKYGVASIAVVLCVLMTLSTVYAATADIFDEEATNYAGQPATVPVAETMPIENADIIESGDSTAEIADSANTSEAQSEAATGKVELDCKTLTLGVGESAALNASISETDDAQQSVVWSSSKNKVAIVDDNGTVKAASVGTAVITATLANGSKSRCTVTVKKAPTGINLTTSKLVMGAGESFTISASLPSGCYANSLAVASSDESVVTVQAISSKQIKLIAQNAGTAVVTVETYNGKTAKCTLTVKNAPTSVSLSNTKLTLSEGEVFTISESIPSDCYMRSFTFTSSDESVATIKKTTSNKAEIVAKSAGTAVVSVETYNGMTADCVVTVKEAPSSIDLSRTEVTLGVGETYAILNHSESSICSGSYNAISTNKLVATVQTTASKTEVVAKGVGTAEIIVSTTNGKTATLNVTVKNAPTSVKLSSTAHTFGVGESCTISSILPSGSSSGSLTYTTDNKSVATVQKTDDNKAEVVAKSAGTAVVTVKTYNGKTAKCTLTVKKAPTEVNISDTKLVFGVGESHTISYTLPSDAYSSSTTVTSSNPAVAAVKTDGNKIEVASKGVGTAVVTVKTYNGKTAKCTVTVKSVPTSISLSDTKATIGVGESYTVSRILPSGCHSRSITYTSSNKSVATVKRSSADKAQIVAKGEGTATITAKTYNGKTAKCTVTVKKAPTSVSISDEKLVFGLGESHTISYTLPSGSYSNSTTVTSSNTAVATVKTNGSKIEVASKGVGTATVTVKTFNGKTAKCAVTVKKAPASIKLSDTKATLNIGEKFNISRILPSGCHSRSITYTSSNTAVATVKRTSADKAQIVAKSAGTATITVKTFNGKTAKCTVKVNPRSYTDDDLYCLAAVIWQEAGAYWASDRLQIMVANVVMNHVASPYFPNTIRGVLTRPYAYGTMAWTGIHIPTASDPITQAAIDRCFANAKKVLDGYRPLPENVIYQAGFIQGSGVYAYESGVYFCYM